MKKIALTLLSTVLIAGASQAYAQTTTDNLLLDSGFEGLVAGQVIPDASPWDALVPEGRIGSIRGRSEFKTGGDHSVAFQWYNNGGAIGQVIQNYAVTGNETSLNFQVNMAAEVQRGSSNDSPRLDISFFQRENESSDWSFVDAARGFTDTTVEDGLFTSVSTTFDVGSFSRQLIVGNELQVRFIKVDTDPNYHLFLDDASFTITSAAAIPEPSTYALFFGGVGLAIAAMRRGKRLG